MSRSKYQAGGKLLISSMTAATLGLLCLTNTKVVKADSVTTGQVSQVAQNTEPVSSDSNTVIASSAEQATDTIIVWLQQGQLQLLQPMKEQLHL